jgi:transposase
MLTVDHFARIRQARRDGLTIRQIADQFGHSSKTILKALDQPEPTPYTTTQPRESPVFGPFRATVDAILAADENAPRKQRHTAAQLFRRLKAEYGYLGCYDQVRRYLQERQLDRRETFIPLDHPPGHRAEADFGHIHVDFPDGRRQVPVLIVTWAYSNAPFALALPTERTEAILHGLAQAFAFFGCVPRELWWDNPKTVAIRLYQGRERTLHPRYAALASHYALTPKFCLPAKGNEKPRVENRVYDLQRRWATPVPRIADLAELNVRLAECCRAERDRTSGINAETIGVRFERERLAAAPSPVRSFDACVLQPGQIDKYQTVRFDSNAYSVPRRWAFRPVTIKGYVDRIEIVAAGQVVAAHARSYGKRERILDPLHYLATLERRPAAVDHAPVYRDWKLPEAFAAYRRELERRHGPTTGMRHFVRILQLLGQHPATRIEAAIEACRGRGVWDADSVAAQAVRLAKSETAAGATPTPTSDPAACDPATTDIPVSLSKAGVVKDPISPHDPHRDPLQSLLALHVPRPDLRRFDCLLSSRSQGELAHDCLDPTEPVRSVDEPAAEVQPQAAKAADRAL